MSSTCFGAHGDDVSHHAHPFFKSADVSVQSQAPVIRDPPQQPVPVTLTAPAQLPSKLMFSAKKVAVEFRAELMHENRPGPHTYGPD